MLHMRGAVSGRWNPHHHFAPAEAPRARHKERAIQVVVAAAELEVDQVGANSKDDRHPVLVVVARNYGYGYCGEVVVVVVVVVAA